MIRNEVKINCTHVNVTQFPVNFNANVNEQLPNE